MIKKNTFPKLNEQNSSKTLLFENINHSQTNQLFKTETTFSVPTLFGYFIRSDIPILKYSSPKWQC